MRLPVRIVVCVLLLLNAGASLLAQPTTIQQPTFGVSVDSDGVLRNATFANNRALKINRRAAMRGPDGAIHTTSECRKISLVALEKAITRDHTQGKTPDDTMLHLAGLQRIEYLFVFPERQDIIIAGRAGDWEKDGAGRVVGVESGNPVILLEDLLVALRTFQAQPGALPWVGCSIDPTIEGLTEFSKFSRTIPSHVPMATRDTVARQIATGSVTSLGMANVNVFGIAGDTHMARVLVEADYRMKLIGLGLEPPPVRMATFIQQMQRPPRQLQRWWFTPDPHRLRASPDGLSVQFVGAGVILSTENVAMGPNQRLQAKGTKASMASQRYAKAFTKKYEQIAAASPVYWQMRSAIDLLVAAAWLQHNGADDHLDHPLLSTVDETVLSVHHWDVPRQAACVANAVWKGNVLIAPVGGGVSIAVSDSLKPENAADYRDVTAVREASEPDGQNWWWD